MTQIETILARIEQLKLELKDLPSGDYKDGVIYVLEEELIPFINSLPLEQPSEDLEKAANKYADDNPSLCLENDGGIYEDFAAPRRNFIAGANWQKEQMMKGLCYETKVYRDEEGDGIDTPIESWLALENNEIMNLPNIGLKDGDKVKVIIVKED